MPEIPQIKRLLLSRFRQFGYCDLDFTHPETGAPLPRVCLLGPNGVGKSTIIELLYRSLDTSQPVEDTSAENCDSLALTGFVFGDETVYRASNGIPNSEDSWYSGEIEHSPRWSSLEKNPPGLKEFRSRFSRYRWSASEASRIENCALAFFSPDKDLVDTQPVHGFREFLATKQAERQGQYHQFLKETDNRERTIAAVDEDFENSFPSVLSAIRDIWMPALQEAYLEFQPDADSPITSTQTGDEIPFTALSLGLRNYLLRIAHIFSQYFQERNRSGFLFLDDPETGMNPDLARNQMQFFQSIFEEREGQLITSTHSPRVASLFSPEERFLLRFDSEHGVAIVPDPPRSVLPEEVEEEEPEEEISQPKTPRVNSAKFAKLKRAIEDSEDQDELADLIDEMMKLRKL